MIIHGPFSIAMSMLYCQRVRGFKQYILIKIIHNAIKCYVPYQNPLKLHAEFNPIFRQSQYPIKWDLWLLCHFWIYILYIYVNMFYTVYTHIGLMEGRSIGPTPVRESKKRRPSSQCCATCFWPSGPSSTKLFVRKKYHIFHH